MYSNGAHNDDPLTFPESIPGDLEELAESDTNLQTSMALAMKKAQVTQVEAGKILGCSQSSISKMLRGIPVAQGTADAALAWIESLGDLAGEEGGSPPRKAVAKEAVVTAPREKAEVSAERSLAASSSFEAEPLAEQSPYESILRTLLEEVAQRRLEELAGTAASGVRVRVTLEWRDRS